MKRVCAIWMLAMCACSAALGRTIELNCFDMTGFAVISPEAPLQGWVGPGHPTSGSKPGNFASSAIDVIRPRSMLVRFDVSQIPKDMRITRAEIVVPISLQPAVNVRFSVYRMVAEWGAGVCERFRMRRPQELPWTEPGARGVGTDRALSATARVELTRMETDVHVNVTADVALWYGGGATNQGWLFCVEDQAQWIRFASPIFIGREGWKLRITYEPNP